MRQRIATVVLVLVILGGCGKKGAPLAPLRLVPAAATAIEVRRVGSEARLHFVLPAGNLNGGGPSVLDRVHIYAVTLMPGMTAPPNRELLTPDYLVGTLAVKPPPVEGEPAAAEAPPDTRPAAGEEVTFVETLTPETLAGGQPAGSGRRGKSGDAAAKSRAAATSLVTAALTTVPAGASAAIATAAVGAVPASGLAAIALPFARAASAAIVAAIPKHPVRVYAVQGVTRRGRPGQASPRVELPLVPVPPPPAAVLASATETAVVVTWTGPAESGTPAFNVYARDGQAPLNAAPLAAPPFERPGVTWGTEECFVVRAVEKSGTAAIESEPSAPACVTPRDTFAPAAPKAVSVVAGPGTINLSWDAGTEADLAGYLVLRGEAAGGALQPLTPAPIAATNYEDKAVTPGVRYAYTIVAVDRATPPNRSAPSARVEETAR